MLFSIEDIRFRECIISVVHEGLLDGILYELYIREFFPTFFFNTDDHRIDE